MAEQEDVVAGFSNIGGLILTRWLTRTEGGWHTVFQTLSQEEIDGDVDWGEAVELADAPRLCPGWTGSFPWVSILDPVRSIGIWSAARGGGPGVYFFGCDQLTGKVVGYIGTAGFGPDRPRATSGSTTRRFDATTRRAWRAWSPTPGTGSISSISLWARCRS